MKELRVTPGQFSILCVALLELEAKGYSPVTCSREAFRRAGLAQPLEAVEIVVDREVMQS